MQRFIGEIEHHGDVYEVMYNTDNADACCRKSGSSSWTPCSKSPNDDWHIKRNVRNYLDARYEPVKKQKSDAPPRASTSSNNNSTTSDTKKESSIGETIIGWIVILFILSQCNR